MYVLKMTKLILNVLIASAFITEMQLWLLCYYPFEVILHKYFETNFYFLKSKLLFIGLTSELKVTEIS
jgi:hypothetical protein